LAVRDAGAECGGEGTTFFEGQGRWKNLTLGTAGQVCNVMSKRVFYSFLIEHFWEEDLNFMFLLQDSKKAGLMGTKILSAMDVTTLGEEAMM
jgi:hypothetical protein